MVEIFKIFNHSINKKINLSYSKYVYKRKNIVYFIFIDKKDIE